MFGKSRRDKAKKSVVGASALVLALAQDERFRKPLLSAIRHGAEAGRRTRRELGLSGAVARLATDEALLKELKSAEKDLQKAYGRLEAKRRSHKLRNLLLLAIAALFAGVPQLRERLLEVVEKARTRLPRAGSPSEQRSATSSGELEELTKEQLYEQAQEADIPGRSEMSKEELVKALRATP
jgi:hypothetical protein